MLFKYKVLEQKLDCDGLNWRTMQLISHSVNTEKIAQLIENLALRIFDRIVLKYKWSKYVRHFTYSNKLVVMNF